MRDKRGRASKFGEKTSVVSFRVPLSKKKFFHKKIKELIKLENATIKSRD